MDFESNRISWRALLLAGLSFVAITLALTIGLQTIGLERLQQIIVNAGPVAPLVYILVRASTFIAAPLSSGPIQFAAGILFGLWPGTLYSLIGEVLGGSVNFWIARRLGRPVVVRLIGQGGMVRVERFYRSVGEAWTLVYARLFLFTVYDFISYAAGFTPMPYRQYLLITALVGVVPTFAAVAVGTTLTGDSTQLIVLYAALGLLCIIPLLFYRRIRRLLKLETPVAEG